MVLDGQGADELFAGYSHHYMALWKENLGFNTLKQIDEAKETIPNAYKLFGKQLLKDAFGLSINYSNYFISDKKNIISIKKLVYVLKVIQNLSLKNHDSQNLIAVL